MSIYKINFYQLIGETSEIEIEANSEEEARDIFCDYLIYNEDIIERSSDVLVKSVITTDINNIDLIWEDDDT